MADFEIGGSGKSTGVPPEHNPQPIHDPTPTPYPDAPPVPAPEPEVIYIDRIVEKKKSTVGYWIAIIILIILFLVSFFIAIGALITVGEQEETIESQENDIIELQNEVYQWNTDYKELQSTLGSLTDRIKTSFPLIISDIEIANVTYDNDIISDYGSSIYSTQARYLRPKLKYYGMVNGSRMLKTKWIRPDGSVISGTSSPSGFSQAENYTIYEGPNQSLEMGGWGWNDPGNWTNGTYRIEIWYGNTCLKSKTFEVYY
ncbi:MAG: hypothetical protein K2O00_03910 [Muribaculaceae bacterium]|nr:hypothetical protein [Muribaculaceae bacterium]